MKNNYFIIILTCAFFFCHFLAQASPKVTSTTPTHNALNVVQNTIVTVIFDTSMDAATFTNSTVRINGSLSGLHTSVFNYNSDLRGVIITPNTSLKVGEVVTVTLTRGIKSIAGDSLSSSYSWEFTIKTNTSSGLFQLSSTVGVGNNPWFIAAGDFDKDGAIDLAVANNNSNTVSILRNDGTGSFSLASTVIVGISPSSITAADLNGDGYMDLATTNIGSGTVSILLNNGNGTFSETSVSSGGNDPWEVVAVDVNGDGALDLAVTNYSSNTVTILRNNGSGTFTLFSNVSVGNVPYSIVPADWDGDGIMDLAVTNSVSNTVSILKNNGNGVFTQASTIAVGNWPLSATALDIDGDGVMDLAVSNLYSDSISILKNNGSGVLSLTSTIVVGNYPAFKAAADIDGDGDLDLVIPFSGGINILQNNGSGTFSKKSILSVGTGSLTRMVLAVDVDGDGRLDLVGVNQGFNSISIFKPRTKNASIRLSSASLSFGPVASGSNKSLYLKIYNDGTDSSLIVTNIISSNSVFTVDRTSLTIPPLSYDSILVTSSPTTIGAIYNDSLTILSNDATKPKIIVSVTGNCTLAPASVTPAHNALNVAPNIAITATFAVGMNSSTFTNSTVRINGSLSGLHTSVFNYNSDLRRVTITPNTSFKVGEVVTVTLTRGIKSIAGDSLSSSYSWEFSIRTNTSSGFFHLSSTVGVGNSPWNMAAGDFDKDGSIDLAVVNNNSNTVSILKNNGRGLFTLASTVSVGSSPGSITAADLNGDGYIDLAVTNWGSSTVSILRNNGDGTFSTTSVESGVSVPWDIAAVDVDGDGALDLAVVNFGSYDVSILKNNGNGAFTLLSTVSVGSHPYCITAADWDGDGIMDLAVANSTSNSVSILKNDGNGMFTQTATIDVGSTPQTVTAMDVNGDGAIDLAVSNHDSKSISILTNNGSGVLTQTSMIDVNSGFKVAVDIDGDGDLDIVTPWYDSLTVLQNDGSGIFSKKSVLSTGIGSLTRMVIAADFDNDGIIDLAGVNQYGNSVLIFKAPTKNATLRLSSNSLSFKPTANGNNKNLYLKIYNDGIDSTLVIGNITSSNSAFTINRTTLTVAPSSCDSILVMFSPTTSGITYNYSDSLMIASNDTVNPIIKVSLKAIPISIWDVPNDHGKQVYIKWLTMGLPINFGVTKFGIYRYDDSIWTFLTEIPVLADTIYQSIVPSLIDSTGENQKYWSIFRIVAYTENPANYTIIGPDSGYSVNNRGSSVERDNSYIPKTFSLSQNYPNPFNPSTIIAYELPRDARVSIKVFNILGQQLVLLIDSFQLAGHYELTFDTRFLPSGIYFYQMTAGSFVQTKKMILMK